MVLTTGTSAGRSEESHDLGHFDNLDGSSSVNVEVSPGSWPVSSHVGLELSSRHSLVGSEDLSSGGSSTSLGHSEGSVGGSILVLVLLSVLLDHGSHEDIVTISGESWGDNSLVSTITELSVLVSSEDLTGVVDLLLFLMELDILVI